MTLGGASTVGGGDIPPTAGGGSPADITGLRHTDVVTVAVVRVVKLADGTGVVARLTTGLPSPPELTTSKGDERGGEEEPARGGVWHPTDRRRGPPPGLRAVGVPDRRSAAEVTGGGVLGDLRAPGLFSALLVTRRSRDASPIDGRIGGIRCRALLFSTGTLVALVVRRTAPAVVCGGVTVGDLLVAPPRPPTPVARVDGGARGGVRAGLAAASFFFADARVTRRASPPDPVLAVGDGVRSGVLRCCTPARPPTAPRGGGVGRRGSRVGRTRSGSTVGTVPGGVTPLGGVGLLLLVVLLDALVVVVAAAVVVLGGTLGSGRNTRRSRGNSPCEGAAAPAAAGAPTVVGGDLAGDRLTVPEGGLAAPLLDAAAAKSPAMVCRGWADGRSHEGEPREKLAVAGAAVTAAYVGDPAANGDKGGLGRRSSAGVGGGDGVEVSPVGEAVARLGCRSATPRPRDGFVSGGGRRRSRGARARPTPGSVGDCRARAPADVLGIGPASVRGTECSVV